MEFAASVFHESIMNGTPIPSLDDLGLSSLRKSNITFDVIAEEDILAVLEDFNSIEHDLGNQDILLD